MVIPPVLTLPADLPLFCENIPIRVSTIDAPEIRGKCDQEKILVKRARDHARTFLESGEEVVIMNAERGKYFRLVSDVLVDGKSLSKRLAIVWLGLPL